MLVACQGRGANGDFEVKNRNCRIFEFGELVKSYTFWQVNLNGDNYGMSSDWPNLKFIMKFYYFVEIKKADVCMQCFDFVMTDWERQVQNKLAAFSNRA
jgi:hypothetical protein